MAGGPVVDGTDVRLEVAQGFLDPDRLNQFLQGDLVRSGWARRLILIVIGEIFDCHAQVRSCGQKGMEIRVLRRI
jgi:hypothetical protein